MSCKKTKKFFFFVLQYSTSSIFKCSKIHPASFMHFKRRRMKSRNLYFCYWYWIYGQFHFSCLQCSATYSGRQYFWAFPVKSNTLLSDRIIWWPILRCGNIYLIADRTVTEKWKGHPWSCIHMWFIWIWVCLLLNLEILYLFWIYIILFEKLNFWSIFSEESIKCVSNR